MKYFECPAVGLAFPNKSHSRSLARIDRIRMYLQAGLAQMEQLRVALSGESGICWSPCVGEKKRPKNEEELLELGCIYRVKCCRRDLGCVKLIPVLINRMYSPLNECKHVAGV